MTQRRILLGYQVENGKAMLNPETAPIIREIFVRYLNGDALGKIAKWMAEIGVLNANCGTFWSHGFSFQAFR